MMISSTPPLHHIRVLDLSRVIAGPLCSMMLSDLGAEVIKIEAPQQGDDSRHQPPTAGGESHLFLSVNRNKKSVALDVRTPAGLEVFWELAAKSDVLVENFRPGTTERLGIDYAAVSTRCPQLVYCSISGYGQTGPMSQRGGYDPIMQAETGMMSINGLPDGEPLRHPLPITDITTAHYATQAILAALLARQETGQGQHIDLALFDVAVATMLNFNHYYLAAKADPPRLGNEHPTAVPMALIDTSTGPFYLALANDRLFKVLCETVLQRPDLVQDVKFASNPARVANRDELMALLRPLFAHDTRENWLHRLQEAGLPAGAIRTISENLTSRDVADRNLVAHVPHPTAETVELVNSPVNFSATPVATPVVPPLLGQHTDEVLQDVLGYDQTQLDQLRQHQAIR